jgi:HK97 family phage prohead protease
MMKTRSLTVEASRAGKTGAYVFPLSSEEPYRRSEGFEILVHTDEAVDLSWLNSGNAPLLDTHDRWTGLQAQIGVVRRAWLENKRVYVEVDFSNQSRAQEIKADVDAGIIRNVSVGYEVHRTARDEHSDEYFVTKWTPKEASFVPIPADMTVGVGRSVTKEGGMPETELELPGGRTDEERAAATVEAINEISTLAAEHNMSDIGRSYINAEIGAGREPNLAYFKGIVRAELPEDTPQLLRPCASGEHGERFP